MLVLQRYFKTKRFLLNICLESKCDVILFLLFIEVRGQENGLDGAKAGVAGRGAERGRRGRGRGRGAVGKELYSFSVLFISEGSATYGGEVALLNPLPSFLVTKVVKVSN